jgi:hypothetical protein
LSFLFNGKRFVIPDFFFTTHHNSLPTLQDK